ncbi:MAG: sigma-70 family RNA polymerase sigma factor [Actinomycetota bacterium]|nr:sigma-70 family RNA polymerase sigma factor [Actinomycetota bacterium]
MSASTSETQQQDLLALTPLIRRVVTARVRDPQVVDDLVQETFARLLQARPRLDDDALAPFAVVLARNVAVSFVRGRHTEKRHLHRLVDLREPDRPEERALQQEEARAVAEGLARLPARDRTALVANEVEGANTAALAAELGSTPGAVAAQLARARAKLRVNYLLAIRGVDLPTDHCRSVLNALSAGDRRRQRALDAGGHLLDCEVCAGLSDPLTERRRALAGFLPLGLVKPVEGLRGWLRDHPGQATAGTGAVVVGAFLATQLLAAEPTAVRPITQAPITVASAAATGDSTLTSEGRAILPLTGRPPLSRYAGTTVQARGVRVQQVAADEGFWVGTSERDRVWVQLTGTRESGFRVEPGHKATFAGRMVENSGNFSERAGLTPREGAGLLKQQGYHIEVRADRLRLSR